MNEAEKLLEEFARKNMIQWNQEFFKRTHSRLHKSIIEALNEALRTHDVSGRREQLICDTCKSGLIDYPDINRRTCRCGGLGYNVTD